MSFNPRPCARGDLIIRRIVSEVKEFQSTPLREGRRAAGVSAAAPQGFQSTPLREGRLVPSCLRACVLH